MRGGGRFVVAVALLTACQAPAARSLSPAPFDFQATPAAVVEGDTLTLSLTPMAGARLHDVPPIDLYVSFVREGAGAGAWVFLDPSGRWTGERVRYRRIDGQPAPVVMRFARVNPFGRYTFRVQFVRAGEAPYRKHYVFPPAVVTLGIRPATGGDPWLLAALALASAVALGVVAVFPRAPRTDPSEVG